MHGRVVPTLRDRNGISSFPRLERVDDYLDWRNVDERQRADDFATGREIVEDAWDRTVSYVDENWWTHLLQVEE